MSRSLESFPIRKTFLIVKINEIFQLVKQFIFGKFHFLAKMLKLHNTNSHNRPSPPPYDIPVSSLHHGYLMFAIISTVHVSRLFNTSIPFRGEQHYCLFLELQLQKLHGVKNIIIVNYYNNLFTPGGRGEGVHFLIREDGRF